MRFSVSRRFLTCLVLGSLVAGVAPPIAAQQQRDAAFARDDAEIRNLISRYVRALDTRDPDLYAGVFTEDAVFDVAGDIRHGRAEIRAIIEGLLQSRAGSSPDTPSRELYHVVVNSEIDIKSATEAHHRAYWQTITVAPDGAISIGAMGIYDDELVKSGGQWLIANRKLTNFAQ